MLSISSVLPVAIRRLSASTMAAMDFETVKRGMAEGQHTLLDVRSREEHQEERIVGARNLPCESRKRARETLVLVAF